KRGRDGRFAVAAIAQKCDGPAVDRDGGAVQRVYSPLQKGVREDLPEQVDVEYLGRSLAQGAARDPLAVRRDEELEVARPSEVHRAVRQAGLPEPSLQLRNAVGFERRLGEEPGRLPNETDVAIMIP